MVKCSVCMKNIATIFLTKMEDGKKSNQALCLSCARKQNIAPLKDLLGQNEIPEDLMGMLMSPEADGEAPDAEAAENFLKQIRGMSEEGTKPAAEDESIEGENGAARDESSRTTTQEKRRAKKKKYLDTYGINLTARASQGLIDRVIGREREIDRLLRILNRRMKNNPVLIGEPGVGKTAIVEALAQRIFDRHVPAKLMNKELYLLDMTALISGTQFRGQFESRMKGVLDEVKALGNIILFIDEIHSLIGTGDTEGGMNAANIMKPALSRGELQLIGATTITEYRRHIEKNAALERRFQPVTVDEPSPVETVEILKGIRKHYEDYHGVQISDEAIEAAVTLSERYINDRFLPDKAIDVIDEAGSRVNLKDRFLTEIAKLKSELKTVQEEKDTAILEDSIENYQKAADLKVKECRITEQIAHLESIRNTVSITLEDIAAVIEGWTNVPVRKITEAETKRLFELEDRLKARVIGQDGAIESVVHAVKRNRVNFRKEKKPASFIFIGPTGVGKTELVKAMACELFDSEESLIRLDMSEYMEKHTVSKMIGSPPGYVGFDNGGQLTDKVRTKPYSIILFDEIEKAHPDVHNMLLQILDDGRLTDSHGRTVNFSNTIIVMTSNAGTGNISAGIGFGGDDGNDIGRKVKSTLNEYFKPEFLNRVDEVVIFNKLDDPAIKKIIDLMMNEIAGAAEQSGITIRLTEEAKTLIIGSGYEEKYGARSIKRYLQKHIEDGIIERYLKGEVKKGSSVTVDAGAEGLVFIVA